MSHDVIAKKLALADHILTQTYPLVQDPKLLVTVCQTLDDAGQLLAEERRTMTPEQKQTIDTLHVVVQKHKDAPVEFRRRQNFVICEDDFKFSVLSKEMVAKHLRILRGMV